MTEAQTDTIIENLLRTISSTPIDVSPRELYEWWIAHSMRLDIKIEALYDSGLRFEHPEVSALETIRLTTDKRVVCAQRVYRMTERQRPPTLPYPGATDEHDEPYDDGY